VLHSVEGLSARGEVKGESRPVLGSIQRQGTSGLWTLWRPPPSTSTSPRIRALTSSSTACVPVEAAVVEVLLAGKRRRGGRHLAILSGGSHAAPAILVEDKHGGATLQTRVSTLARPVSVAGFAKGHIAVCVILAQRMLLAAGYILGPVAGVGLLVVKEPANAELLGCCAVPAGPVARAGSLVAKDAVEPVAVLSALWRIHFWPPLAVDIVRVVALANEAKPSIPSVYKTVGTALKEALALVAVVVEVTSRLVPN